MFDSEVLYHTWCFCQITFPRSVRDAYLVHNGEKRWSDGLFGTWRWLTLQEVVFHHNELAQIEEQYHFCNDSGL